MNTPKPEKDRILVVGYPSPDRSALVAMLTEQGYEVRLSSGGRSEFEAAREYPPDLFLLASRLPDMDSYELCRLLTADESTFGVPVIFVGTLDEPLDRTAVFSSGAADYIMAPFHEAEVLARVRTQVALNATKKQLADRDAQLEQAMSQLERAEEAIWAAEESGHDLIDSLTEVIYTCESKGILTYVSSGVEALLGYHPSEIMGQYLGEFVHEEDLPRVREAFGQVLSGQHAANEYRVVTKSGEVRWVRTSSQPSFVGDRVMGTQGVLTDVTDQRLASQIVRQQNEFLHRVLESLTHPFYVLDAHDYTVQIANSAALREGQAGQVTCYTLTHGRSSPCVSTDHPCPLEEIKSSKQPLTVEHIHFDQDGNARNVEVYGYPLLDSEGDVVQVIEYSLDITERRQAEESLRRLAYELTERVKELDCLYGISALVEKPGITLAEILQGTADLVPLAWQHPEITCARVTLDGQEFSTENFSDTPWQQLSDIHVYGRQAGCVQVCYLEERQELDEGAFLKEERNLINAIAQQLGRIVERMRTEEALEHSEERYALAQRAADVGSWDWDIRTGDLHWSDQVEPIFGLAPGEFGGTYDSFLLLIHPEDRQCVIDAVDASIQRGTDYALEHRIVWPDGTVRWMSEIGDTVWDEHGKAIRMLGVVQDITERRLSEQALREAKESAEDAWREEGERRREAERRRQIAESLANVLAALNSDQSLDRVLEFIARQSRRLLDSQAVAIFRLQSKAGTLILQAAQGLPSDCLDGTNPPPGLESLGQAIASSQPVVVPYEGRAQPDSYSQALDVGRKEPGESKAGMCQALLAVPIVGRDLVYGGIVIYDEEPRVFSDDDLELAIVFGDQVALAIESARLREHLKEAAAAAERSRLARDLHDSVTQALFSASLVAEVLPQVWQRNPDEGQQGLQELRHLTRSALAEMRTMLLELRPQALLETTLDDLLLQLTEAITSRAELVVSFETEPIPALPPDVHVTFYRVSQEALHNVVKYAEANHLSVGLRASPPIEGQRAGDWQGQVILHIRDDGGGFDPESTLPGQLGLDIMRERAEEVGALLSIRSSPGRGTQITLVWRST